MKKLLVLALVVSAVSFGCSKKEETTTTETAPVETTEVAPVETTETTTTETTTTEVAPAETTTTTESTEAAH